MTPTLRASVLRIVANAFPALAYGYPRTYVVASVAASGALDLVPPSDAMHLAELAAVTPYTIAGVRIEPAVGTEVLVVFADADPRRPRVLGFAAGTPANAWIDAGGTVRIGENASDVEIAGGSVTLTPAQAIGRVVRYGDPAAIGAATGVIVLPPPTGAVSRVTA